MGLEMLNRGCPHLVCGKKISESGDDQVTPQRRWFLKSTEAGLPGFSRRWGLISARGAHSAASVIDIAIGVPTIVVGLISFFGELRQT